MAAERATGGALAAPDAWRTVFTAKHQVPTADPAVTLAAYTAGAAGPLVLLLHGANYTALSFHLLVAKLITVTRVVAFDARGHGASTALSLAVGEPTTPTTADALTSDCNAIVDFMSAEFGSEVPIVLVGHSLGAAIVSHVAALWCAPNPLGGVVLMDMVEGTAMPALPGMKALIGKLPSEFDTVEAAVEWTLTHGVLRLRASAEVSLPYALQVVDARPHTGADAGDDETTLSPAARYQWRAWPFMLASQEDWEGWFAGTSSRFLALKCPKLLILAGVDTLDSALTIGQMQGKFQLSIIAGSGHVVHEDAPDKVSEAILSFLSRNGLTSGAEMLLLQQKLHRASGAVWG